MAGIPPAVDGVSILRGTGLLECAWRGTAGGIHARVARGGAEDGAGRENDERGGKGRTGGAFHGLGGSRGTPGATVHGATATDGGEGGAGGILRRVGIGRL